MILKKIMMNCVVIDDNASAGAERWCHGRHDGSIDILLMGARHDDRVRVDGFVDDHIYYVNLIPAESVREGEGIKISLTRIPD
jgi:hypothetical protein